MALALAQAPSLRSFERSCQVSCRTRARGKNLHSLWTPTARVNRHRRRSGSVRRMAQSKASEATRLQHEARVEPNAAQVASAQESRAPAQLRTKALDAPTWGSACGDLCIEHPIVQSKWMTLPDLDALKRNARAAPMRWPWHWRVRELLRELGLSRLKCCTRCDRLRLRTRPRIDLTLSRSLREVCVALSVIDARDGTFDPNLSVHDVPEKEKRYTWVGAHRESLS